MTNLEFDIPKDKGFEFVTDDAIIFGGAVRDVIRNKEINDIDLLFASEEELNNFASNIRKNYVYSNVESRSSDYSDLTYGNNNLIHKIVSLTFNDKTYKFDCLAPKDQNKAFISDFDVNSLFATKKDNKLVVSGSVFKPSKNEKINHQLFERLVKEFNVTDENGNYYAFPIFNKKTILSQKRKRSSKINKNGFAIHTNGVDGYNHTDDQFLTIKEMFEAAFTNAKKHCIAHYKHELCVYCVDENSEIISKAKLNPTEFNKEEKMTTKPNTIDWLKKNAEEGAYAGMATSATNNLAKTLVKTAEANNVSPEALKLMKDIFESSLGKAGLASAIGAGIHFIPVDAVQNNKHIQKVADKCVQNASSTVTEEAINSLLGLVLPAIMGAINTSPQLQAIEKLNALSTKEDDIEEPVAENVSKLSVRLK